MVRPLLQLLVVAAIALAAASPASPGRRLDRQLARQLDALQNLLLHRTAEDPSTTAEQASEDPNTAAVRARALERRGLGVYAKARCLKWLYSLKLTANGLESQVDYVITELSTLQKDKAGYATPSRAEVLEFIAENVDFSDSTSPTSTEVKDQLLALVEAYVAAAPDTQVALELAFRKIMVESIAAAKKSMQDKQDAGGDSTLSGVAIDELDFGDTNGSKGKQVALMLLAYHKAIAIQETFALLNSFLMEKSGMDKDPKEGIKKMEAFKATESGTKYAEAEEFKNKAQSPGCTRCRILAEM